MSKKNKGGNVPPNTNPPTDPPGDDENEPSTPPADPPSSMDQLPEWAQKEIKSLRNENKERRLKQDELENKFNSLEKGLKSLFGGDEDDPEKKQQKETKEQKTRVDGIEQELALLHAEKEQLAYERQLHALIQEHDIPKEHQNYFIYLIDQQVNLLEDDEVLAEDTIKQIVEEVHKLSERPAQTGPGGKTPPSSKLGNHGKQFKDLTLEKFLNLNVVEQSRLYREDQATYETLSAQAKKQNKLVR